MTEYIFSKAGITKLQAFDAYMHENFAKYNVFSYSDPDLVIGTTVILDSTEEAELTTLVNDYVDPAVFLVLLTTVTDAARSKVTSSDTLDAVHTFIFSPVNLFGEGIFNALKTVVEYSTTDISAFASGSTACTVVFQIYDYTREVVISSNLIDISNHIQTWQTEAQTQSGPRSLYESFMVEGLRNSIADYDCIWQFKISVSNPNVIVSSHSMQRLYYAVL